MKYRKKPLRSHISEARAKIELAQPTLAAGYREFLVTYGKFLELRRQFEVGPNAGGPSAASAPRPR